MILPLRILAMHRRFCHWPLPQPNNSSFFSNRREKTGTNTKAGMKKTSVGGGKKKEQDWGAEGEEKARYPQPCCLALIEL